MEFDVDDKELRKEEKRLKKEQRREEKRSFSRTPYDDYEDEQPEPMACAIRLCDIGGFPDTEYTQHAVIAISYNPAHADTAADFLNDLLRNVEK